MDNKLHAKFTRLKARVAAYPDAVVAFSGGTDSTLVLKLCHDMLGSRCRAVMVATPLVMKQSIAAAKKTAVAINVPLAIRRCQVLRNPAVLNNRPQRCYACKKMIISQLRAYAQKIGMTTLVNGANADDFRHARPGTRALREAGVRSPLAEVGLTKLEVRELARHLRLANWNIASESCLATRFPFNTRLTGTSLATVARAEHILRKKGLNSVRCRVHRDILRIEVSHEERQRALRVIDAATQHLLKRLGFRYICLDIEGFRSGSMDSARR